MATRTLLCVEPDEAALAAIVGTLEPYGFVIKNILNGDSAVEWAKNEKPALMMVSVEPKKVGYAICNKIKRNVDLKDIPLILTSSDESPEKFEQHKTFKLCANDYMFKPLDRHELMRKINVLVGLEDPEGQGVQSASAEIFSGTEIVSSEIAIDADDIVDETRLPTPPPQSSAEMERAQEGGPAAALDTPLEAVNPVLDAMFEQEAEAAFDALDVGTPEPLDSELLPTMPPSAPASIEGGAIWVAADTPPEVPPADQEQASPQTSLEEAPPEQESLATSPESMEAVPEPSSISEELTTAEIAAPPAEVEGDPDLLRHPPEDVPPDPEEVRNTSVVPYAGTTANDAAFTDLQKRVHDLEDEKRELTAVIDDLRTHLQSQPFHREKDLLSLRETINRKEKDILDLRDSVDAKDRLILDHKDRMREHERARRDLEEKMLTFEKSLMHANEKVVALAQDKEKAIERERGLKARLEDYHVEANKSHDELDLLKKRLATIEDRNRLEVEKIRHDLEAHIAEIDESHRNELSRLKDDREAEKASRESEFQAELFRLGANHSLEIETLHKRQTEEKASLEDTHDLELTRLRREQEKTLLTLRDEHAAALEAEKQDRLAAMEAKDRDHRSELAEQRRNLTGELTVLEDRRRRELEEADARRMVDLDAADGRRRSELQARDEQHHAATAELERRHLAETAELVERHRVELEQAQTRAAALEVELTARSEELAETHRRLVRVEGELDTARTDTRDREVKLGQARDRITELEAKIADLEDQALRAYRRIKDDEKAIDKAKRAVSVALTLLDDRSGSSPALPTVHSSDENPT